DNQFLLETGVRTQCGRNGHTPLFVRNFIRCSREKNSNVVPCRHVGQWSILHLGQNLFEFPCTKDVNAVFLSLCQDKSTGKFLTELCGKNDPALLVKAR